MRDGLLRQGEPLGNEAAHGVVRHELVRARLVESEYLGVGHRLGRFTPLDDVALAGRHSDLQGLCLLRRGVSRLALYAFRMDRCSALRRRYRALDIALYDAAVRARA